LVRLEMHCRSDPYPLLSSTLATDYAKFKNAFDAYIAEKMAA
jgi:hypothetical protein